jgi:hypothetical protein
MDSGQLAWPDSEETWLNPTDECVDENPICDAGISGWLAHKLPHFRVRHIGLGQPLEGTSWLNRPFYVGGFLGESFGGNLMGDELEVRPSVLGGLWLGCDLNHYWGSEMRLALNYGPIRYALDVDAGANSRNELLDINLLYYPWGDSRWRPYASVGLGIGGFHFDDEPFLTVDHTGLTLPWGCGVKYLCGKQLALRLDVKDNLIFGGHDVDTIHNWSLTGGIEFHWGSGTSLQYSPW